MKQILFLIVVGFIYLAIQINAQQLNYTEGLPDYSIDLRKAGSSNPFSDGGLFTYNSSIVPIYQIGKIASTPTYAHGVYQWNINNSEIPNGSTIHSVTVSFDYLMVQVQSTTINYFNCNSDIADPNLNLTTLYNSTNIFATPPAVPLGEGEGSALGNKLYVKTTFNNGSNFVNEFTNSINQNDKFTLGIAWKYEGPGAGVAYWNFNAGGLYPSISVSFTPPIQSVTVDQKLSNNSSVDSVGLWNISQNKFDKYNVPQIFNWNVNDTKTLQCAQKIISNENYNFWVGYSDVKNHQSFIIYPTTSQLKSQFNPTQTGIIIKNSLEGTSVDGGQVEFRDPWFIDYPDPTFGNQLRNRGMNDAIYYQRPSPFNPSNGSQYKGVFLNQPYTGNNPVYYKVGMPTEQTISVNGQNRKFFPYKWSGNGVTFQTEFESPRTGVVFTSSAATATAILKGQLMSNDQNAISSASQRKIVRTDNGRYHAVYESMGTVWYAHSATSDFYGVWNPDQLIDYYGKNPSIDYDGDIVKIAFEKYDPQIGGNANICLYTYVISNGVYELWDNEIVATYPSSYYGNAKPVISYTTGWAQAGEVFVAYRTNTTEGIKQRTRFFYMGNWSNWTTEAVIPGTNSYTVNPAVIGEPGYIHFAYEYLYGIYYKFIWRQGFSTWNFNTPTQYLSSGSGFNYNSYPAISFSNNSPNRYVLVSWQGVYDAQTQSPLPKENGSQPLRRAAAVVKVGYGQDWGTTSNFSNNVDFTNNGSLNTLYGSIMTWSESNGQYSKYVRRRNPTGYDPITPLFQNGIQTLVSNGTEFGNVKAMVFNKSTNAPYFLNRCTNDFTYIPDGLGKITEDGVVDISYGRSGIVEKNGIEFVFNIGDVLLNGETTKFLERVDTLPIPNITELNLSLRTDTLNLNEQSELIFSDYYYVVNSEKADSLLSNEFNVNFKCELVKLSTGEVVGEFEEVNYNKNNLEEYGQQGYLIDCSGIEAGEYYLRLTTSVNDEVNLSLSDIQMDNVLLEKSKLNVRNFKGSSIPLEYALEQNYPNPFNPTTTIRYQLPKGGMVTLKVYDILGAEVKSLVNEEQVAGKYEVNFNARNLASGVYIYRLSVNDFVNVKKM